MKNLAGVPTPEADEQCESELNAGGIPIRRVADARGSEVAATVQGALGMWRFRRGWYYWIAIGGPIDMGVARKLYADPVGEKDVRVLGDCACRSPDFWNDCNPMLGLRIYHIDSPEGLRLFADAVRKAEEEA